MAEGTSVCRGAFLFCNKQSFRYHPDNDDDGPGQRASIMVLLLQVENFVALFNGIAIVGR